MKLRNASAEIFVPDGTSVDGETHARILLDEVTAGRLRKVDCYRWAYGDQPDWQRQWR